MAELQVIELEKRYSGSERNALTNCHFSVKSGQFISITGPAGSGKSTLLRLLAGLTSPDKGKILIDSKDVTSIAPEKRRLAMVFQHFTLYPHMSVRRNISFGLKLRNYDKQTIDKLIIETAGLFELSEFLDSKPQNLTPLQQQQVALARALSRQPQLLLLDDPMAELSDSERMILRRQIVKLHRIFPCTIIFSSSNPTEALSMADRVLVLQNGKLVQSGTPANIYQKPINIFTARFFGTPAINLIKVRLKKREEGSWFLEHNHFEIAVPNSWQHKLYIRLGYSITLGIRAEDFIELKSNETGQHLIKTTIEMQEHLGSSMLLYLKTIGTDADKYDDGSEQLIARIQHPGRYNAGDLFYCSIDTSIIHLFDSITGERIL